MNRMIKRSGLGLVAALLACGGALAQTVKIAYVDPLSGGAATIGEHGLKTGFFALLDLNGSRSGASEILRLLEFPGVKEKAGLTEVYNVLHGFEGDLDEGHHRNSHNGWRFEGLPWTQT